MGKLQQTLHKVDPVDRAVSSAVGLNFAPKTPTAPTVTPMPDEAQLQAAKKRSLAAQIGRTGRASTILSDPSERLGP